jgi:hypothetical protein
VVPCFHRASTASDYIQSSPSEPRYALRAPTNFKTKGISFLDHRLLAAHLVGLPSETYAVDITNTYFGDSGAVVPWSTFKKTRFASVTLFGALGTHDEREYMVACPSSIKYREICDINTHCVEKLFETWLGHQQSTVLGFLTMPCAEFATKLDDLECFIEKGLAQIQHLSRTCGDLMAKWSIARDDNEKQQLLVQRQQIVEVINTCEPCGTGSLAGPAS